MKKLLIVLFSLAAAIAALATDTSVAGIWKVDTETAGNTSVATLTLEQAAKKLTGSIKMADGKVLTVTGAVDGNKVKWSFVKDWEGNPLTITYEGTVDAAGAMSGSTEVQPMGIEGAFSAKRAEKQ